MKKVFYFMLAVALAMPLTANAQVGTPTSTGQANVWQGEGVGVPRNPAHRGVAGKPGENAVVTPYEVQSTETVKVSVDSIKGDKGDSGLNGANGTNGTNGVDGLNGTNGTNGAKGDKGDSGLNGTNGANGTNGTNGTNGRRGRDAIVKHHYVFDNGRWTEYLERESAQDTRIDNLSTKVDKVAATASQNDQNLRQEIAETYVNKSEYAQKNKADLNMIGLVIFAIVAILIFGFAASRGRRN
jgi:hypothetical protein